MSDLNHSLVPQDREHHNLMSDCERCFGLCCVALPYATSTDFAMDKQAGEPCCNLQEDFRCGVHPKLRELGFRGCTVYDCFGAGQKVSQVMFRGRDWRSVPESAQQMFEVFPIMKQLHELLWYLAEALTWQAARPLHEELRHVFEETEQLTRGSASAVIEIDIAAHREKVNEWLLRTSQLVRGETSGAGRPTLRGRKRTPERGANFRGADLIGAKFQGADLREANLRGACLIAADLRDADLRRADLIGADFRDANLSGADLTDSLFLTQAQLQAARGDARTKIPPALKHPLHWMHNGE